MKAAFRDHYRLISQFKIGNKLFRIDVDNSRANRDFDDKIVAATSSTVAALPRLARLRAIARLEAEIDKSIQAGVSLKEHAASVSAIATIGTATFYVFFAPKTQCATAATSSFCYDFCFIYEFHFFVRYKKAPSGDEAL